jgi:hypothetical protein
MTTPALVGIALVAGLVGGIANLCARLITPGQTFLKPPEGLPTPWSQIMGFLTYTADLVLGAIAGLAVLGVGGVDTSDLLKLIGTCIVAGVGGAGFLANLGSKAQAGAATATTRERLNQANGLLVQQRDAAANVSEQAQATLDQQEVPTEFANQLTANLTQMRTAAETAAEARPQMPPE